MASRSAFPPRAVRRQTRRATAHAFCIAATLSVCGCASILDEDGALTVVPYRVSPAGQIVVDATIDGAGPFVFAFDTGASISVIFDDLREDIGLECEPDRQVMIQGMVASGRFPIAIVERLRIGNEEWRDARLAAMPGNSLAGAGIDGILGLDLLRRYAISVSSEDSALRLFAPEAVSSRAYRGWAAIPMREIPVGEGRATVYAIDIRIGTVEIPALLDLGASSNVMNWRAAGELRVRPLAPRFPDEIAGAVERAPVLARLQVGTLKTGRLRWSGKDFVIADFPVFGILGLDDRPMAIVGAELFSRRDFVIDFTGKRLLVRSSE